MYFSKVIVSCMTGVRRIGQAQCPYGPPSRSIFGAGTCSPKFAVQGFTNLSLQTRAIVKNGLCTGDQIAVDMSTALVHDVNGWHVKFTLYCQS